MSSLLKHNLYKPIPRVGADSYEGQVCYRKEIQEGRWPPAVGTSEVYFTLGVVSQSWGQQPHILLYLIFYFKGIPIVPEDVRHFSGFWRKGKACPRVFSVSLWGHLLLAEGKGLIPAVVN